MGLDTVELVYAIENYFGIRISDDQAERIYTVQELADAVCRLRGGCDASIPSAAFQIMYGSVRRELQTSLRLARQPELQEPLASIHPPEVAAWQGLLAEMAHNMGWNVPDLRAVDATEPSWLARLLMLRQPAPRQPDWRQGTLADLVGWIISLNYQKVFDGKTMNNAYDVLRAVMGIVSEKSGLDIWEIYPPDSFTNDLGMD